MVIVHGYLLRGTGSNIYSVNVAKTLKGLGHAVTVVCQDNNAGELDFVDECIIGTPNVPSEPPPPGSIRVVVPDIDGLLLVYVYNKYEGFQVKEMGDASNCSFCEIDNHIEKTAAALRRVLLQRVDHVLTNHALLSPVIARRACQNLPVSYDVKIHGSAISFSLKQRPELMKYAVEGLSHSNRIVAGTSYISKMLSETFKDHAEEISLERKKVIIPPGMDPDMFKPLDSISINQLCFKQKMRKFTDRKKTGRLATNVVLPIDPDSTNDLHASLTALAGTYNQWAADVDLIQRWPDIKDGEPVIIYFGSYLHTKGVGEIVASFPKVLESLPQARLLVVGYGGYREHMEGMLTSMESGDMEAFVAFCGAGQFLDASPDQLRGLYRKISAEERQRICITGIMEHSQLCEILPMASVSIVASKHAEAFGMVMVEAMSSGVLPLSNYHSGLVDVLDVVKKEDPSLEAIMHMETAPGGKSHLADGVPLLEDLPKRILGALQYLYPNGDYLDHSQRDSVSQRLRKIAVENFSWSKICMSLLQT